MSRRANWKLLGDAIGTGIYRTIETWPDKRIKAMLRSLREVPPSQSNCWWISYRLAPIVADVCKYTLHTRRCQRKRIAAATTPFEKVTAMIVLDPDAPTVEHRLR